MEGSMGTSSPKMDWESPDLPATWRSFKQHVEFTFGGPLKKKSEAEKCNYLMIWVGEKGRDIYNTWTLTDPEKDELKTYYDKFEAHVQPKSNTVFMRYKFNLREQIETESFNQFVTELRLLSKYCNYGANTEEMIRDRIVFGCRSKKVRENLIKEGSELTLEKAIDIGRTQEMAHNQLKKMESNVEEVNAVKLKTRKQEHSWKKEKSGHDKPHVSSKSNKRLGDNMSPVQCGRCGRSHDRKSECPATGKVCAKCNKMNHFAKVCKTKQVNTVEESSDSDNELYVGAIESEMSVNACDAKEWCETLKVNNQTFTVQLDTGAKCNVVSVKTLKLLKTKYKLENTSSRLKSYSGHVIDTTGVTSLQCMYKDKAYSLKFHVVASNVPAVIGAETCKQLGLIKRVYSVEQEPELQTILKDYPDLVKGLGCLPGEHSITIDPSIKPVIHPPRKVPISLKDKVKK